MRNLVSVFCLRRRPLSRRPHGFKTFIARGGYHGIYLVGNQGRISFHKSQDPRARFCGPAISRPVPATFLQAWWVAGKPIASRIERAFKGHFDNRRDDDGFFNTDHDEAAAFIEEEARGIGTRAASESDMINLMDLIERHKRSAPGDAPTPLKGLTALPPPNNPSVLIHFSDCLSDAF